MVAASTLLLSSTYKTSVFSEINPIFPYSFSIKIVPTERSFESQNSKKNSSIQFWAKSVSVLK